LERGRLESSLQIELAERRRLQQHSETLQGTLDDVSAQLKEKAAAEQAQAQREAELESRVHKLQQQVTESSATAAVQEAELRSAKGKLEEVLLIQSALCARVQELTAVESALARTRQDLAQQLRISQGRIKDEQRDLAALRYAILDAARASAQVSRGQIQTIGQSAAGAAHVTAALLNSPLSLAQRRLVNSLQDGLESWMKTRIHSASASAAQIEAPVFQAVEFSLSEVTTEAFRVIERQAVGRGIEVQTKVPEDGPERILGDAAHIGQLLSSLPEALLGLAETKRFGLKVSVEPKLASGAELIVEAVMSASSTARELCERFTTITAASEALRCLQTGDDESSLAVCWQLAQALGGTVHFEPLTDKEVRLRVVLPVEIASPLELPTVIPASRNEAGEALDEFQLRCLVSGNTGNSHFESEPEAKL
jgi:hypothetical protein